MGKFDKKYEAMKLFVQQSQQKKQKQFRPEQIGSAMSRKDAGSQSTMQDGMYYEIEYDATPMPGVGKFVLKSQKVETPKWDEIRERFDRMREIARRNRVMVYGSSKFYNSKVQQERARIFYKQAQFMKDFQDEFAENAPYSEYFPCYQMMGYRQLRTYFTWRTKVRQGQVEDTSLSYAYLYLYELINNIGVANPQEGLDKLLFFWNEFRVYQPAVDKHVPKWLKDYHIYYGLEQSFLEFVTENEFEAWYPELAEADDKFSFYCDLAKYDIRKSKFYTEDRESLIRDCFQFTFQRLNAVFEEHDISLEDMIFMKPKTLALWMPFQDALFYPWLAQGARQVVISQKETYVCTQSQWYYQVPIVLDGGKQFLGYILKQMEVVLRQAMKYKYKIAADISVVPSAMIQKLEAAGISLEQSVTNAVKEFYREATKTVVTVDRETLEKIRREALQTQEKLIVPEEDGLLIPGSQMSFGIDTVDRADENKFTAGGTVYGRISEREPESLTASSEREADSNITDPWLELKAALSQTQQEALRLALQGNADIKGFADAHGIMLEVLADGINEKAMDVVGDSLLDEEFTIYSDYVEQIKEILEE